MSRGHVTLTHPLASPESLSRSKKTEIPIFSFTNSLFNVTRLSSIPPPDRANVRPAPNSSLCRPSNLSTPPPPPPPFPHPHPTHPVLQIREIQTSNERLCDYELHQRPARRAKPDETSGKKGEWREGRKEGRSASGKKVKER